jgi:hypothetical protein
MMKILSVVKQKYGKDESGNEVLVGVPSCVNYYPRTIEELMASVLAEGNSSFSNKTTLVAGKVEQYDFTKENGEKFQITFVYHEMLERECWAERVKQLKGAIQKEIELLLNTKVNFDTVNFVDKVYF